MFSSIHFFFPPYSGKRKDSTLLLYQVSASGSVKSQNYMWNWDFWEASHLKPVVIGFLENLGGGRAVEVKFTVSSPFHVSKRRDGAVLSYESSRLFSYIISILIHRRVTELTCFLNLAFSKEIFFSTFLKSLSILNSSLLSFLSMPEIIYSPSLAKSGAWSIFWTKGNKVMAKK